MRGDAFLLAQRSEEFPFFETVERRHVPSKRASPDGEGIITPATSHKQIWATENCGDPLDVLQGARGTAKHSQVSFGGSLESGLLQLAAEGARTRLGRLSGGRVAKRAAVEVPGSNVVLL